MKSDLENQFHQRKLELYESWKPFRYFANRFLMAVRNRGGFGAAKYLLAKPGVSPGLLRLAKEGRTDLSVESLVLTPPWDALFTDEEKDAARQALTEVAKGS